MLRALLLLAVPAAAAACSPSPHVIAPPPPGISYRFEGDNIAEANLRADEYCKQYGKHARLQTVDRRGSDHLAVYDCT